MPSCSVCYCRVICPSCGQEIAYRARQATFYWGWSKTCYSLGEEIIWLRDRKKVIVPPFTWYRRRGWLWRPDPEYNFGSPDHTNLIAFDSEIGWMERERRTCSSCNSRYDHIGVIIRDSRISEVKVFAAGEIERMIGPMDPFAETVLIRADGAFEPRPDWNDPPMTTLES